MNLQKKKMNNKYDYWFWKNVFSKKEIKTINQIIKNNSLIKEEEKVKAKNNDGSVKKNCDTYLIQYKTLKNVINKIEGLYNEVNDYNFGYNLFPLNDDKFLNFNIYSSNNFHNYEWHVDESNSFVQDIKLTLLINLSVTKYEGGDFLIFKTNELKINEFSEPGDMLMFKSGINHKVSPVTNGERRTLAIFLSGPKFI